MSNKFLPNKLELTDISHRYKNQLDVTALRADKIHPLISGNKWYKLRFYIEDANACGKKNILTFGGAWSNHILATAALAKLENFTSHAVIRGEEPTLYSSTLLKAQELGMQFHFVDRNSYKEKSIPDYLDPQEFYIIPEGGYGEKGAAGASTLLDELSLDYTHIMCAVGTGTTMAGLINQSAISQKVTGISVLKNNKELENAVKHLLKVDKHSWEILHGFDFGGYAKYQSSLISFMNEFYTSTNIPTDFVYTGKLFYAVEQLYAEGFFPIDSKVLILHSGGLQGNQSLDSSLLIF